MARLPEPDWITLSDCPRRVERAFSVKRHKAETGLVGAFHDGKIRTRGRCRSYFSHERLDDVARSSWDRVSVDWQANKFDILYGSDPLYFFSDVVVCGEDLAKWINGAKGIGQHLTAKVVQSNKGGRPPTYDWDAFHREVIRLANLPDGLPETQAELERQMAVWCSLQWGVEPSESVLKEKVRLIFQQARPDQSIS